MLKNRVEHPASLNSMTPPHLPAVSNAETTYTMYQHPYTLSGTISAGFKSIHIVDQQYKADCDLLDPSGNVGHHTTYDIQSKRYCMPVWVRGLQAEHIDLIYAPRNII